MMSFMKLGFDVFCQFSISSLHFWPWCIINDKQFRIQNLFKKKLAGWMRRQNVVRKIWIRFKARMVSKYTCTNVLINSCLHVRGSLSCWNDSPQNILKFISRLDSLRKWKWSKPKIVMIGFQHIKAISGLFKLIYGPWCGSVFCGPYTGPFTGSFSVRTEILEIENVILTFLNLYNPLRIHSECLFYYFGR